MSFNSFIDAYCPSVKMYNSFEVYFPLLFIFKVLRELFIDLLKYVDFTNDFNEGISSLSPLN